MSSVARFSKTERPPRDASGAALPTKAILQRAHELYVEERQLSIRKVDASFARLMLGQYVACVLAAIVLTPYTWQGGESTIHMHVWAAVFLGGMLTAFPVILTLLKPGQVYTRHVVAAGQMLMSGLLIHVTGGRIETHFHVFVSLALLAFYRDWKVLVTGAALVTTDHLLRGIVWPESIFGVASASNWRWVEHAGWVFFEVVCLTVSIQQGAQTLWNLVQRRAELEQARDEAEHASHAKDEFLAVLSHELRTPLTPSLMALSALAEDPTLSEETRNDLALVRRNVDLEARLIDDLLDLTRIARGKLQLTMGQVDLHQLLEQLLETCRSEIQQKDLVVKTELNAEHRWLYGDSARLQQVFWNLLRNAMKFTPTGGRITVRTEDAGDRIRVDVTDTGMGIAPEVLPKLFTRFEQGDASVTKQFGGLGLGLSICRAIVDLHRGAVRAESRGSGWGATFTVVLPARARAVSSPKPGSQTQFLRLSGTLPRRVLLVDDHLDTRELLKRLLTKAGYEVTSADSVADAKAKAEQTEFDILVSDIGLPDGTGCDLMVALKQKYNLRGIAFSGFGMEEDVQRSIKAGFYAHLTKPVDFGKLKEAMRQALSSNQPAAAA